MSQLFKVELVSKDQEKLKEAVKDKQNFAYITHVLAPDAITAAGKVQAWLKQHSLEELVLADSIHLEIRNVQILA
jgi:hypothetical protein